MSTSGSRKNNRGCLYNIDFSNAGFTSWFESRGCPVGQAYRQGYRNGCKSGYAQGFKRGKAERNSQGTNRGRTESYEQGYKKGYKQGTRDGYRKGKNKGYSEGFQDGTAQGFGAGYEAALKGENCQGSSFDGVNVRRNEEASNFNNFNSRGEEFYSEQERNEWDNYSRSNQENRWNNNYNSGQENGWNNNCCEGPRNDWSDDYRAREGNERYTNDGYEGREFDREDFRRGSESPRDDEFNNFMSDL